jgi:hypothetical protein
MANRLAESSEATPLRRTSSYQLTDGGQALRYRAVRKELGVLSSGSAVNCGSLGATKGRARDLRSDLFPGESAIAGPSAQRRTSRRAVGTRKLPYKAAALRRLTLNSGGKLGSTVTDICIPILHHWPFHAFDRRIHRLARRFGSWPRR